MPETHTTLSYQGYLSDHIELLDTELRNEIKNEPNNEVLNTNGIAYIDYLVKRYLIPNVEVYWSEENISDYDEFISEMASNPCIVFQLTPPIRPKQEAIIYRVPISGSIGILSYAPKILSRPLPKLHVSNNELIFQITYDSNQSHDALHDLINSYIKSIKNNVLNLNAEITNYNSLLESKVTALFNKRKEEVLKQYNLLASLSIPIKRIKHESFKIPINIRESIVKKPKSSDADYKPYPKLDDEIYEEILRICHESGKAVERHPSLYKDTNDKIRCEESLRDLFIVALSSSFYPTGETFNKTGKTDILIIHENTNVFVAEFKFWSGHKTHNKTINQILDYLTWRDSKAAILYFVDNKKLNPILDQIDEFTLSHPCFVKKDKHTNESCFNYHFRLPSDESCGIQLAILFFHFG